MYTTIAGENRWNEKAGLRRRRRLRGWYAFRRGIGTITDQVEKLFATIAAAPAEATLANRAANVQQDQTDRTTAAEQIRRFQ